MKTAIAFTTFLALAAALPRPDNSEEDPRYSEIESDDRVYPHDSGYSTKVETSNGILISEAGSAGSAGQINVVGVIKYTLADGTEAEFKYIADEFGYKPESDLLPVAPVFPHPIPQHALDQIAFAEEQRRLAALEDDSVEKK